MNTDRAYNVDSGDVVISTTVLPTLNPTQPLTFYLTWIRTPFGTSKTPKQKAARAW